MLQGSHGRRGGGHLGCRLREARGQARRSLLAAEVPVAPLAAAAALGVRQARGHRHHGAPAGARVEVEGGQAAVAAGGGARVRGQAVQPGALGHGGWAGRVFRCDVWACGTVGCGTPCCGKRHRLTEQAAGVDHSASARHRRAHAHAYAHASMGTWRLTEQAGERVPCGRYGVARAATGGGLPGRPPCRACAWGPGGPPMWAPPCAPGSGPAACHPVTRLLVIELPGPLPAVGSNPTDASPAAARLTGKAAVMLCALRARTYARTHAR